jgi:hypothetical protein
MNKYWPIHGCIRETVIIHQKPVILTKQAIVLVNAGIGEYNGADHPLISTRRFLRYIEVNIGS